MKLGFVSDIHEDIKRLKRAIAILESQKCDKIICLGDMVGYSVPYYGFLWSRSATEVLKFVKKKCDVVIAGNHELFAIKKLPKHKAGFKYPKNWYSLDYWKRKEMSNNRVWLYEYNELPTLLTKVDEKYIGKLPEFVVGNFGGVKILLSHYAYPDLVGATKYEAKTAKDLKDHFKFMKKHGCKVGISGHDHKEGMTMFTPGKMKSFTFGKVKIDKNTMTWVDVPSVANGSFANGITIFDTKSFEVKIIPLKSKKHLPPEWRKL
jgi:predicted phosphodiesterase